MFDVVGKQSDRYHSQQHQQIFQTGLRGRDWSDISRYEHLLVKHLVFPI